MKNRGSHIATNIMTWRRMSQSRKVYHGVEKILSVSGGTALNLTFKKRQERVNVVFHNSLPLESRLDKGIKNISESLVSWARFRFN